MGINNMGPNTKNPLLQLSKKLDQSIKASSEIRIRRYSGAGQIECYTIQMREVKAIIDDIDMALSEHYGFTEQELDFIINYDVKYRMGLGAGDEGDE